MACVCRDESLHLSHDTGEIIAVVTPMSLHSLSCFAPGFLGPYHVEQLTWVKFTK